MAIIKNIKNDGASGTIKLHGLISVLTYGDFGGGTATIEASADSNANTLYSEILDANPAGTPGQLILADLSAEGEGNYYATAESNGNGVLYVNMGDSIISNMRALEFFAYNPGNNSTDWLNLTSTTEFGIPNYVALGTFTGQYGSAIPGSWRNLKIYKQAGAEQDIENDKLVSWWPLNTKGSGSITGFIEKDIVGNYDGSGNIGNVVGGDEGTWVAIKDKFGNTPSMTANDSFTLDIGSLALRGNLTGSTDADLNFAFAVQRGSSNTSATVISNA